MNDGHGPGAGLCCQPIRSRHLRRWSCAISPLVHSVASRQVGDPHFWRRMSRRPSSSTFLRTKPGRLAPTPSSQPGCIARRATLLPKLEGLARRRQQREHEAYMQSTLNDPQAGAWAQLSPLLDEAMAGLGEPDRAALVLRFFENKTASEIARGLESERRRGPKTGDAGVGQVEEIVLRKHGGDFGQRQSLPGRFPPILFKPRHPRWQN